MIHRRLFLLLLFIMPCLAQAALSWQSAVIQSYNNSAFYYKDNDPEKATRLNEKAFKLIYQLKSAIDPIIRSNTYGVRGVLAFQKGNYKKAQRNYFTALDIRLRVNDHGKIGDIYTNIANLYYKIDEPRKAVSYYKKALYQKSLAKRSPLDIVSTYNGLALVYESLHKKDSLEKYYRMAFEIIDGLDDKVDPDVADIYSNYGQYNETNENFGRAMLYYNKALTIEQQLDNQYGMAWTYHHMGIVKDYQHNSAEAKRYFRKAEKLAFDQSDLETQRDICESWMYLYTREKKPDSVAYYFERYKALDEKINKEKTDKHLLEVEAKYQTEKKDQQLKLSREENKLQKAQKNSMVLGFTLGAIIIITVFYFLIRNYRQKQRIATMQVDLKNKEINELLSQQETASYAAMLEGQDHERFRIAQDLHDRLGSTLATIKLGMQGDPVSTNDQNQQLVDTAITEVRAIAHNLSGGNIERYGLNAALTELKTTLERSGKMRVNLYLEQISAGNQLSIELYRIIQELVSNTLKHANADEITIQTSDHLDNLNLIYEDNGSGFDVQAAAQGMGLRNIHLRLKKWDGTIEIDTQPRRGTIAIINVPKNTAP